MGIDEAGRGSIFGPLIIGAAMFTTEDLTDLVDNGLKDSKLMTITNRERLYTHIQHRGTIDRINISAEEIDHAVLTRNVNLNRLEIQNMAKLIVKHQPNKVIIDAISSPDYFKKELSLALQQLKFTNYTFLDASPTTTLLKYFSAKKTNDSENIQIIAENKADFNYPVVSAASVVAKVERDISLRYLETEFQLPLKSLGKGYPNKASEEFLKANAKDVKARRWPFIRYSWHWAPLLEILQEN